MSTSRVVTITDPDEAVRLFRAGLLLFYHTGTVHPLLSGWEESSIRKAAVDKHVAMLIEEDDSLIEDDE